MESFESEEEIFGGQNCGELTLRVTEIGLEFGVNCQDMYDLNE